MRRAGILAIVLFLASVALAQTVSSFDGIDASQVNKPEYDVDPNGAIGTKQFMEYVNLYYQAYDKVTFAPVWSNPQPLSTPFTKNGLSNCASISGDGMIIFDRLASRWVLAGRELKTIISTALRFPAPTISARPPLPGTPIPSHSPLFWVRMQKAMFTFRIGQKLQPGRTLIT